MSPHSFGDEYHVFAAKKNGKVTFLSMRDNLTRANTVIVWELIKYRGNTKGLAAGDYYQSVALKIKSIYELVYVYRSARL